MSERLLLTLSGGVVWTQMSMGSAQALSAAWLTAKMEDHKRPIALAAYVMSIQLANFPGNQLFRAQGMQPPWAISSRSSSLTFADAPRYSRGLVIAASCACAAAVIILVWKLLYRLCDRANMGGKGVRDIASG